MITESFFFTAFTPLSPLPPLASELASGSCFRRLEALLLIFRLPAFVALPVPLIGESSEMPSAYSAASSGRLAPFSEC